MGLNYSLKLLFSNFSNTWKILLYKIFVWLCAFGLTTVVAWNIVSVLIDQGFFVELSSTLENLLFNFHIDVIISSLTAVFNDLITIISGAGLETQAILVGLFSVILYYFLNGLFELGVTQEISGYMSSLISYGFINCYISNLGKSIVLQLAKILVSLPFDILIIVCSYLIINSLIGVVGGFFALFVALTFAILIVSLKFTVLCCWSPAVVVNDSNPIKAFWQSVKAISKRFFRTWSSFIMLSLILIIINAFVVSFTVGVGLILTLPISSLILIIYKNVTYYSAMGMRFYTDSDTIVTPKKLEEQDKLKKVKNII